MKATVLQVLWHDKEQVLSCDFEPAGKGRLVTSGGDKHVRLWQFNNEETSKLEYLATLTRHEAAVNVVRWAPGGGLLASAGDDKVIIIWEQIEDGEDIQRAFGEDDETNDDKENWRPRVILRGTVEEPCADIYDLAWSPDGRYILSGSIDYRARIWDVVEGKCVCILREHNHFVQGVAWDPLGEYIATQSSDRSVCVYKVDTSNKKVSTKLLGKVSRLPIPKGAHAEDPLQEDDTGERSAVPEPGTELSERPSSPTPAMSIKGKEVLRSGVMPVPSAPAPSADVSMAINLDEADAGTTSGVEDAGGDEDVAMASSANPSGDAAATPAAPTKHGRGPNKSYRMFHDDTLKSFFRRLAFSNDGSMLFAPAGQYKSIRAKRNGGEASSAAEDTARSRLTTSNTVLVFARSAFQRLPIAHFPGHKKPTVAVRFNPIHFAYRLPSEAGLAANALAATEVRDEVSTPITPPNIDMASRAMFQLRQRLVFAVATTDTVLIYDTQQQHPICAAQNLHYAPITDVAWSMDGNRLLISSADGYCSMMQFDQGELGPRLEQAPVAVASAPKIPEPAHVTPPESPPAERADETALGGAAPPAIEKPLAPPAEGVSSGQKRPVEVIDLEEPACAPASKAPAAAPNASSGPAGEQIPKEKKRRVAPTLISTA